jgi:glycolate oxidase FAD binding subunit
MTINEFISVIQSEFPADRLTYQKGIPTFHPESADEAATYLRLLNKHRQTSFVTSFGNNIDPVGERFANMITIRTDRLNQLIEIAPGDLYIRVGGGYPLREINQHIRDDNLYFPHSALPYVGSVGGALAVNLTADLNGHDLPIKKYFIKASIVLPTGEIITPGSVCFKSVAGYDIVKLFAGSWGLLGLIVTATFRVLPTSAAHEYNSMRQKRIDRARFLSGLVPENTDTDAIYSRKVKEKFDPNGILPIV